MDNCLLTIFTPVYNRAKLVRKTYESLCGQSDYRFQWLIVDDGSEDHLCDMAAEWISSETRFSISYERKENGGLHTAYNLALSKITTPYWVCIDSDDTMPENAVALIYAAIEQTKDMAIAGIIGLDSDVHGNVLGGRFPADMPNPVHLIDIKLHYHRSGDKKVIYRTEASRPFTPMPEIPGEPDLNPYYMMLQIDTQLPLYAINEVLCIADYQPDGMTRHVWDAYLHSPVSMGLLRLEFLKRESLPRLFAYRQCIHYVSSYLLARKSPEKRGLLPKPVQRPLMVAAWLPGAALSVVCQVRGARHRK